MENENEIDESKVEELMRKIVTMENVNLKTHKDNDAQMIKKIRKEIEEVVKCY